MCGIAGMWTADGPLDPVAAMAAAIAHRGPDGSGHHRGGRVGLGARRLSVVDIEGGAQPAYDESGRVCVVANGEVYNHNELRASLTARGHRFASRSDTEVIVHLYEEYGDRCVDHLRGMFAFAIADGDRLLLARDRLGIKPLYYAVVDGTVLFASEIKALPRYPGLRTELDTQALADSVVLGNPFGDRTFLSGVRRLMPGHTMVVEPGPDNMPVVTTRQYYALPTGTDDAIDFDTATRRLGELLDEVVEAHLAADVDVALMLSGGLDSTVLAMTARDVSTAARRTYGVADHANHPDVVQGRRVAASLGWSYDRTMPTLAEYLDALPAYTYATEQPGMLGGLPLLLMYARAGAAGKVGLIGEGADELFGGYPAHVDPAVHSARALDERLARLGRAGLAPSAEVLALARMLTATRPADGHLSRMLSWYLGDPLTQDHLEFQDKIGMAAGLELRLPFLDHRLVEFVVTLPVRYRVNLALGVQKNLLKHVALRRWGGNQALVDSVLRRKTGAPSAGYRHRNALRHLCDEELPDDYLARHELGPVFETKAGLLTFELFHEMFVVGRAAASPSEFPIGTFIRERSGRATPVSI
jgi:asparagine synthase (glutamine-hydrolysing)